MRPLGIAREKRQHDLCHRERADDGHVDHPAHGLEGCLAGHGVAGAEDTGIVHGPKGFAGWVGLLAWPGREGRPTCR